MNRLFTLYSEEARHSKKLHRSKDTAFAFHSCKLCKRTF